MTAEQIEADPDMLEVQLFDIWVIGRRQGCNPDVDELAMQLPEERRGPWKQMVRATAALQILAGISPRSPKPITLEHLPARDPNVHMPEPVEELGGSD